MPSADSSRGCEELQISRGIVAKSLLIVEEMYGDRLEGGDSGARAGGGNRVVGENTPRCPPGSNGRGARRRMTQKPVPCASCRIDDSARPMVVAVAAAALQSSVAAVATTIDAGSATGTPAPPRRSAICGRVFDDGAFISYSIEVVRLEFHGRVLPWVPRRDRGWRHGAAPVRARCARDGGLMILIHSQA